MPAHPPCRPAAAASRVSLDTLLAGVRYVRQNKVVLGAISLDLFAVLLGGAVALLPIFAKDILHVGPWGLGLLRGAPALGALAMSIALTRWPIARHAGAQAVGGGRRVRPGDAGLRPVDLASRCRWLALVVTGAADMVSVVVRQTLIQLETPDAMRGRVSAVNLGVHRRVQPARRVRVRRHRGLARARWARWCWAAPARCWWPRCGGAGFPALARRDALVQDDASATP